MSETEIPPMMNREERLALVAEWQRQLTALSASHEALRAELEQLTRRGKRQAAPFAKGTRATAPTRPGRTPGAGPCCDRATPRPEAISAPPVDVPVTLEGCPTCGAPLAEARVAFVSTTDRAPKPCPPVTPYRVRVCRGTVCGTQVCGQPPDVAPDQAGATAHRLGSRVLAMAHVRPDAVGIPVRQVPAVLHVLTGVPLTPGARTQDALRRTAATVGTAYEHRRAMVPPAPVVQTDDPGWRVGGEPAHLMVCETDAATVYQIRPRQRHEEVHEVMPTEDPGGMVTDRGRSDDARAFADVHQQTCLAHMHRSIRDVWAMQAGRARDFGAGLKAPLQDARPRWHAYHEGLATAFVTAAQALQEERTDQRRPRRLHDRDHQRRRNARGWHHDRGNLVRLLRDPAIDPTNHRAERALRPAVLARNVSPGSKHAAGAQAFAVFTSVVRTLAKQGAESRVEGLSQWFRSPRLHDIPS